MKVLLWSPHGAGEHYGGPGTSAFRLYALPGAADLKITLAHGFREQGSYPDVFAGQEFVALSVKNAIRRVGRLRIPLPVPTIRHATFIRAGRHYVRRNAGRFDVFHGLMGYDQTVRPAREAESLGLPAFVKVAQHRAELAIRRGPVGVARRVQRRHRILSELTGVIALTDAIAQELLEAGVDERRIALIPNGVDTARFRPMADAGGRTALRKDHGWRDVPTILFVGSLIERKRPHLILEALSVLARQGVECQAVLVGPRHDPRYFAKMEAIIVADGLAGRVIWSDFRPDVEKLYRAADVFCLPSRGEGLSNALLEAMASGIPVVCTDVSGTKEVLSGDPSGVAVSAEVTELADALRTYLEDSRIRQQHGHMARIKAERRFSGEAVLALHKQVFRCVLQGGMPADVAPI